MKATVNLSLNDLFYQLSHSNLSLVFHELIENKAKLRVFIHSRCPCKGVITIKESSSRQPKDGRGRLMEAAALKGILFTVLH